MASPFFCTRYYLWLVMKQNITPRAIHTLHHAFQKINPKESQVGRYNWYNENVFWRLFNQKVLYAQEICNGIKYCANSPPRRVTYACRAMYVPRRVPHVKCDDALHGGTNMSSRKSPRSYLHRFVNIYATLPRNEMFDLVLPRYALQNSVHIQGKSDFLTIYALSTR